MIVDLLRNDVGRLATPGTVSVDDLFAVETYETVLQMTSTIRAQVDAATPFETLVRCLFPCGSITGAPKIRTMQIIHELEDEPRGVYTGAIGFLTPDNDACFNVAIRTVTVDHAGAAVLGVGCGVIFDSDPIAEYDECRLKARFFTSLAS